MRNTLYFLVIFTLISAKAAFAQDFKSAMQKVHNIERANLGIAQLEWNDSLSSEAKEWANYLAQNNKFEHANGAQNRGHGENLWMGTKGFFTFENMAQAWVDEKQYFTFNYFPNVTKDGNWQKVGHYTQIVWRNSTQMGCAIASNAKFDYLVCRYNPAGNFIGQKPY